MGGLSLVAASGGHSSLRCVGLSLSWPLLLRSTGSRRAGSAIVAHGPSHSEACGIFPDQGSNPCPLHWQADSQPLCHQGSSGPVILSLYLYSNYFGGMLIPLMQKGKKTKEEEEEKKKKKKEEEEEGEGEGRREKRKRRKKRRRYL